MPGISSEVMDEGQEANRSRIDKICMQNRHFGRGRRQAGTGSTPGENFSEESATTQIALAGCSGHAGVMNDWNRLEAAIPWDPESNLTGKVFWIKPVDFVTLPSSRGRKVTSFA